MLVAMYQFAQQHTPADNFLVTTVLNIKSYKGKMWLANLLKYIAGGDGTQSVE
jgi:hypothetical protein